MLTERIHWILCSRTMRFFYYARNWPKTRTLLLRWPAASPRLAKRYRSVQAAISGDQSLCYSLSSKVTGHSLNHIVGRRTRSQCKERKREERQWSGVQHCDSGQRKELDLVSSTGPGSSQWPRMLSPACTRNWPPT